MKKASLPILFFCMVGFLSSCSSPCCFNPFQRPSHTCENSSWVLDYNECFKECPLQEGGEAPLSCRTPVGNRHFEPAFPICPDYTVAKGDVLEIFLFDEDSGFDSQETPVAPDGYLYYSILKGISVEGMTPLEVAKQLEEKLKKYYIDPMVTVVPKATHPPSYKILGRVVSPGEYPMTTPITLREAIGEAGGILPSPVADFGTSSVSCNATTVDLKNSFLARNGRQIDVDFTALIVEGDVSQNIYVHPEDYIYLAAPELSYVFMLGPILAPQRVAYHNGVTLMGALATAGGWPPNGPYSPDLRNVLIIRGSLERPRVCQVDVKCILDGKARDVFLQPGDIVYAQPKKFQFIRELTRIAIESFFFSFVDGGVGHWSREHVFSNLSIQDIEEVKIEEGES